MAIKQGLEKYARASGQLINFDRSYISWSKNILEAQADKLQGILGVYVAQGHALYLGLPTFSQRQKRVQFGYIRERVI